MITGFTNHALVVFPDEEVFEGRSHSYAGKLIKTTQVLKDYLNTCGITFDCFATDTVAVDNHIQVDRWIGTLGQGDMFFIKTNCEGVFTDQSRITTDEEIVMDAANRFPIERGSGFDTRFETVIKRDTRAKRILANRYKLLVLFASSKKMPIHYKHEQGTMCIEINAINFMPTIYMAKSKIDPIEILGIPNGNAPVYEWEVSN